MQAWAMLWVKQEQVWLWVWVWVWAMELVWQLVWLSARE
jgi:hypothetical protein